MWASAVLSSAVVVAVADLYGDKMAGPKPQGLGSEAGPFGAEVSKASGGPLGPCIDRVCAPDAFSYSATAQTETRLRAFARASSSGFAYRVYAPMQVA